MPLTGRERGADVRSIVPDDPAGLAFGREVRLGQVPPPAVPAERLQSGLTGCRMGQRLSRFFGGTLNGASSNALNVASSG
jgi:hypothetical protein